MEDTPHLVILFSYYHFKFSKEINGALNGNIFNFVEWQQRIIKSKQRRKRIGRKPKKSSEHDEKKVITGTFEEVIKQLLTPIKEPKKN